LPTVTPTDALVTMRGVVKSSLNGQPMAGVTLKFVSGSNAGKQAVSGSDGSYTLTQLEGERMSRLEASKEGWETSVFEMHAKNSLPRMDVFLSPFINPGSIRIVLSWSANPSDLDIHMVTPTGCKVWYANRKCQDGGQDLSLDFDVQTGYGPETISVNRAIAGQYRFYVNKYAGSGSIEESEAKVQVMHKKLDGQLIIRTYKARDAGNFWTTTATSWTATRSTASAAVWWNVFLFSSGASFAFVPDGEVSEGAKGVETASYAFGSETSTDVTAGFARITSAAQCESGARALGGSLYRGNLSRADAPLGCFFDKSTNSSWFNTASSSNVQYTIRKVMAASFVPCPTCASKAQVQAAYSYVKTLMTRQWESCQLSDGEIHGSGDNYAVINKALPGFDCYLTYGSPYRSIFVQLPRPPASLAPTGLPSRPPTATPTDSPRMPQTHNPTRMPTKTPTDAPVRITGYVKSSVNGQGVSGVTLLFSGGPNFGKTVTTTADGSYAFDGLNKFPSGKLEARKAGFELWEDSFSVGDKGSRMDIFLSPSLPAGSSRIVLQWKSTPQDLDMHLVTPTGCVVSYMEKECRGAGQNVALDFDVTNGFGPETITLHQMMAGQYKLLINKYSGSNSLRTSGATVKVFYKPLTGPLQTYDYSLDSAMTTNPTHFICNPNQEDGNGLGARDAASATSTRCTNPANAVWWYAFYWSPLGAGR